MLDSQSTVTLYQAHMLPYCDVTDMYDKSRLPASLVHSLKPFEKIN